MQSKSDDANSEVNEFYVELKYCERCGGLWLRPAGAGQVYCSRCEPAMAELPRGIRKRTKTVLPAGPRCAEDLHGYAERGGLDAEGGLA